MNVRKIFTRRNALIALGSAALVVLLSLVATFFYAMHLSKRVSLEFEGRRFDLPARVYGRPLELFLGARIRRERVLQELQLLNYSMAETANKPGSYASIDNGLQIYGRGFEFWDGAQLPQRVQILFDDQSIVAINELSDGSAIELLRMEPVPIGGITGDNREDRQLVRYSQLPRHLVDELIAVEDKRFFAHSGVDIKSLGRAVVATLSGDSIQGGSTLTQQLIKNFFLTPERTLSRKYTEMLMAWALERKYDKQDILETYFNEVFFGQDGGRAIHGVGLASQFFFGRSVEQLEPQHSALLVGLLKGPSYYNPRRHPDRALARRNLVLKQAFEQGYLPEWDYQKAIAAPLELAAGGGAGLVSHPAFIELVFEQLRKDYPAEELQREGLRIYTTLDPGRQATVEALLEQRLDALEPDTGAQLQAAAVMTDSLTGEITALVGGRRAPVMGFNRALLAQRPVGSLLKPAVYLTALMRQPEFTLASLLDDSPLTYDAPGAATWEPQNYDSEFHGQVPAWLALANSYNVAAARLGLEVGIDQVLQTLQRLGVKTAVKPFASTILGASEMTPLAVAQLYQTLAAGGFQLPLKAIREVMTPQGQPLQRYPIAGEQTLPEAEVYLINRALQLAVEEGTGRGLQSRLPPGLQAAGKTGTTDDYRDSWFAGFTGNQMAVVWVGSDDNAPIGLSGGAGALPIWADIIAATDPLPLRLAPPESIVFYDTDRTTGAVYSRRCGNAITLPFIKTQTPPEALDCEGRPSREPLKQIRGFLRGLFDR